MRCTKEAVGLSIISLAGTCFFLFIKKIDTESVEAQAERKSPMAIMKSAVSVLSLRDVQLMLPIMMFSGMELAYWQSVYPTCIGATKYLGVDSNRLVGLCSIFTGLGDILASLILFKKNQQQIRGYFVAMVWSFAFIAYFLPSLSLPPEKSVHKLT